MYTSKYMFLLRCYNFSQLNIIQQQAQQAAFAYLLNIFLHLILTNFLLTQPSGAIKRPENMSDD